MVAVLPGEYLHILSDGEYPAALHRVLRPQGGVPRMSAPLLVRGSAASGFSGQARDGTLVGRMVPERVATASDEWWAERKSEARAYDADVLGLRQKVMEEEDALQQADDEYDDLFERMQLATTTGQPTEDLEIALLAASHAASEADTALRDAEDAIEDAQIARAEQIAKDGFWLRAQRAQRESTASKE